MAAPIVYSLRCVSEFVKSNACISNLEQYVNGLEVSANGQVSLYLYAPLQVEIQGNSVITTDVHGRYISLEPEQVSGHTTIFSLKNFIVSCNCNCVSPPMNRQMVKVIPDTYTFLGTELGVEGDTTISNIIINLPNAANFANIVYYANAHTGANAIRLTPLVPQQINKAAFYDVLTGAGVSFVSDAIEWYVFGNA